MTDSMSSPTYPACVRAVQSQIAKGTSKHRAIVCASKVLPNKRKTIGTCEFQNPNVPFRDLFFGTCSQQMFKVFN